MPQPNPNWLVVEGPDDLFAVAGLMAAHVAWPKPNHPVHIEIGGSVDEILRPGYLSALVKGSTLKRLGVMIDADDNAKSRYARILGYCRDAFPNLPEELPEHGVVVNNDSKRFGVWVMPNNAAEGYLEVFLKHLVPNQQAAVWQHAVDSVEQAVQKGATVREVHKGKANLYTWLSWQDPPGRSPGTALLEKALDPACEYAGPFVKWFMDLYELKALNG